MLVRNPTSGEIGITDDATAYLEQGWQVATPEEADAYAKKLDYGTFESQALAQTERVVRGGTFGLVEGLSGSDADVRARADVSRELSPVTSFAADVLPDVAVATAAALTGGAAGAAAGLGRAGARAAALGAESVAAGAVGAGQQAFEEGRTPWEDIGRDAENALIWGGLNFGLGGIALARAGKGAKATAEATDQLDDVAAAAEAKRLDEIPEQAAAEAAPPVTSAPLDDVHLPDAEGMLDAALPDDPRLAAIQPELDQLRTKGIDGMSLKDLRALPIDEGPGAAQSAAKVAAFETDETFLREGMLPSNNDRGRGGLPSISIFPDEPISLSNGRHRLTAARKNGLEEVVMNVKKYDAEGNTIWDYVGPVRVNPPKVPAGAVREAEKEAVEDGLSRAVRKASKAEADDIVRRAVSEAPEKEADSFSRQRRLYQNREAIIDVATVEMQRDLTKVVKDVGELTRRGKIQDVARAVGDNVGAQRQAANSIAKDAARFAGELRAEAKAYGAASGSKGLQYSVPGAKGLTLALMDHAKQIQEATTGRAMFEAIDDFKRVVQDYKLSLEQGSANSVNPIHHLSLIPKVQDFASKLRVNLEDAGTWGKAGDMQSAYNAVIHDRLLPSMRIFEESVLEKTHKGYDAVWETEGWERKISSLLKGADPGKRRHVGAVLDAMSELASVDGKFGGKKASAITDAVDKLRRTMALADEVSDATERMQAVGAIAGMVPGAPKQWLMGDLANNFRRLTGATDAAVGRSVDDWIRSSRVRGGGLMSKLPKLPKLSDEAGELAALAKRRGVSHAMALFMGEDENATAAFEKRRDALMSDEKFAAAIGGDYRALQVDAPEAYMLVAARASTARNLLLQRMPPNVSVSMMRPGGYPPSRESVEDWAIYWNAVQDPMRVIRNLPSIRPQEIETLKSVYPRLYEQTQQQVLERIGAAQVSGEPLDDTLLMRMDLLFDLDGAASPAFSSATTRMLREHAERQAQQQGGGSQSPPAAPRVSPVQSIAASGATFGTGF